MDDARQLYEDAVRAIQDNDDVARGRKLLVESLRLDPDNDAAWVWLARAVTDHKKQVECLNRALNVNPDNAQAHDLLDQLDEGKSIAFGERSPIGSGGRTDTSRSQESAKPARRASGSGMGSLMIASQTTTWSQAWKLALGVILLLVTFVMSTLIFDDVDFSLPGTILAIIIFVVLPLVAALSFLYTFLSGRGKRIEVYEGGIAQIHRGKRQAWRWEDFAALRLHMSQVTTRYFVYSVIPAGSGTTTQFQAVFYNANKKKVLALGKRYRDYFKMGAAIVRGIGPALMERDRGAYRCGETLQYGSITVNRQGIRSRSFFGSSTVALEDIQQWWTENTRLRVKQRSGKTLSYDLNNRENGFVLPLLLGEIAGARQKTTGAADLVAGAPSLGRIPLLAGLIAVAVACMLVVFVVTLRQSQQAREELVAFYGTDGPTICQSAAVVPGALSRSDNKYLVIAADYEWIYHPFHDALSADQRAASRAEVTAVICLLERATLVEECEYGDESVAQPQFTVNRYRNEFVVSVIDLSTGSAVIQDTLRGTEPDPCPDEATSRHPDFYGSWPTREMFLAWLPNLGGPGGSV